MHKKNLLVLVILVLSPGLLFSQINKALHNYINDSLFKHAGISICIRDLESGEILAAHNENMALTSASVMKLITTGSVLDILGPDYRYSSSVGYTGTIENGTLEGNIIIKGGGDPVLGSEYFEDFYGDFMDDWARSVAEAGIKKIRGSIIADASVFKYHPVAPGWSWGDLGNYYGAGVHGISVFDNMYRIYFRTEEQGSVPVILGLEPDIPGLLIKSELTAEGSRDNGYVYIQPYGDYAEIKGTIPAERDSFALKASIPDPPMLIASLLDSKISSLGIEISEKPTTFRRSAQYLDKALQYDMHITHTTLSPELSRIIACTNLESVNLFAETLAWTLDYQSKNKDKAYLKGGLDIIRTHLETSGINTSGLYITDGSGLSRTNALSSSFLTDYLAYMGKVARYHEIFRNTLAVPGKGTLEPYFLAPELINNLRAKSGTVTRARNYGGYLICSSGREVVFGILSNNYDCTSHEVSKRVEKLLIEIYKSY